MKRPALATTLADLHYFDGVLPAGSVGTVVNRSGSWVTVDFGHSNIRELRDSKAFVRIETV